MPEFIDSHCHLDFDVFSQDLTHVLARANEKGVHSYIIPAVTAKAWRNLIGLKHTITSCYIAFGLHPYFIAEHELSDFDALEQMLANEECVAVGECGLDSSCDDIELQKRYFLKHIELANQFKKPLIVHHRNSHHLIFQCFKQIKPLFGGVIHAFSGSLQDAEKYIVLGFMLGAGGVITFERAQKTRNVFKLIPLSSIVLETDSPDMPLSGKQGMRNEPCHVVEVAECLAQLKEVDLNEVARVTTNNCRHLFKLD